MVLWDFCVTKKGLPYTLIRFLLNTYPSWAHNLSSRLKIFNSYWLVARVGPRPWPERSEPLLKIFFIILFIYPNTFHFIIFLIVSENFIKVFYFHVNLEKLDKTPFQWNHLKSQITFTFFSKYFSFQNIFNCFWKYNKSFIILLSPTTFSIYPRCSRHSQTVTQVGLGPIHLRVCHIMDRLDKSPLTSACAQVESS